MTTFRNVSGGHLDIPVLGVHVRDKEEFDVVDEDAETLTAQPAFQLVKPKKGN